MSVQTHQNKTIHVASDHAGYELKETVKASLETEGWKVVDHGAHSFDSEDDFPDYIFPAAEAVASNPEETVALIFGGSGQGEAMAANRISGIRATVYYGGDSKIITLSRDHNDANVLSIGARFVSKDMALKVVKSWLTAPFKTTEKRERRNSKLDSYKK